MQAFLKTECTGNGPKDHSQSMKSPLTVMNSVAQNAPRIGRGHPTLLQANAVVDPR